MYNVDFYSFHKNISSILVTQVIKAPVSLSQTGKAKKKVRRSVSFSHHNASQEADSFPTVCVWDHIPISDGKKRD